MLLLAGNRVRRSSSGSQKCPIGNLAAGTRIIYDRNFLMECRNSPVAKTPPCHLPDIPGVTSPSGKELGSVTSHAHNEEEKPGIGEEAQFDMDI
uniref:Eukaryotic translation initiation factor 4E-binding protein 1 n=1 Tax=Sphaerodactylus townsendi TaxID=933632 RepID=A0ACB8EXM3_9SAUR